MIITEMFPRCDICLEPWADFRDQGCLTTRNLRQDMKIDGWLYLKVDGHYIDICPECVEKGLPDSPEEVAELLKTLSGEGLKGEDDE